MQTVHAPNSSLKSLVDRRELTSIRRDNSDDLSALHNRDYMGILGKFHAHITVLIENERQYELLKRFCNENRNTKLTIIDLDNFKGRKQRDFMITRYYRESDNNAVHNVIDDLKRVVERLNGLGLISIRVKLEHQDLPTIAPFNGDNYREIHIKLLVPPEEYDDKMAFLRDNAREFGYVPSGNINEDTVHQFINVRYNRGGLEDTDADIERLVNFLRDKGRFKVVEIKKETAVFDTNLGLDRWWAGPDLQ